MSLSVLLPFFLLLHPLLHVDVLAQAAGTPDGFEEWGYVEVRPKAHLFWWHYKSPYRRMESPSSSPWPIVLWLQGGPGGSSVGVGNFLDIGPLDMDLRPRNSTWLQAADLLFVDSPVGSGFSYVEDMSFLAKTEMEVGMDLTTLLKQLFNGNQKLQESPLYVFSESYGGRFGAILGLLILRSIRAGELKLKLGGIAMGNSWMSPGDLVLSWAPLLKDLSRLDENGFKESNSVAEVIRQQVENGQYKEAADSWKHLSDIISRRTNFIEMYNFLYDESTYHPIKLSTTSILMNGVIREKLKIIPPHLNKSMSPRSSSDLARLMNGAIRAKLNIIPPRSSSELAKLMNGAIRAKLNIIPPHVKWEWLPEIVYDTLHGEFMIPRISEVDELLREGVNVIIYNGQLDVVCSTRGTEAWLRKLKWEGMEKFWSLDRTPLYCGSELGTKGYKRSYKNLHFYWILGAGHLVTIEQPCVALRMMQEIVTNLQAPAASF